MCAQPVEDARDRSPVAGSVGTDVSTELHPPRWAPLNRPARYSRPHTLVGCVRRRCISSMNSPADVGHGWAQIADMLWLERQ